MSAPVLRSLSFRREREGAWRELDRIVTRAEAGGLRSLSARDLGRLPGLYRLAASSLSVARAISLDRNVVAYLDALTVRAYGCVYASRRRFLPALGELVRRRVPQAVRAGGGALLAAAALMVLGVVVGWATTAADPERFYAWVPGGLAGDRGPHASTESLRAGLYDTEGHASRLVAFAVALFTHNTTVGVLAFAVGVLAGLPTALLLFWNGAVLGAFAALYAGRGLGVDLWAWLLPHGVPELTAVTLCGAAGFSLTRGLLFPGPRPRGESVVRAGREAAVLVVGAAVLLMAAALLEGVLRQVLVDPAARLLVAAAGAAAIAAWFTRGGRGAP